MKWILILIGILFSSFAQGKKSDQFLANTSQCELLYKGSAVCSPSITLIKCIDQAWNVSWNRFYNADTQLFYDYLSSYKHGKELSHLPTADEVLRQYPNNCGYDTGMEDCMISAGVILSMIVDRYEITKCEKLRKYAYSVFQGIKRCASVHGVPGFLARGVCVGDRKSIYISSSRDQYTHAVHGLWCYFHSPLCDSKTKIEIGKILSSIADRMKQNVTPGNDYDSMRADGTHDTRGISRMWNVSGHEAARLPMIYAAAWNTTGNEEYYQLYRKYIEQAIRQSFMIEDRTTTYALLQVQCSLELLLSLEREPELINQMKEIMMMVSKKAYPRAINANNIAGKLNLSMVGSDWRTGEGLNPKGEYRKVWYCIRESGEAALAQLMYSGGVFPEEQKRLLIHAIMQLDYRRVSSNGIFYLQGAYWKARKLGIFNGKE
jgi:hypothetical protein